MRNSLLSAVAMMAILLFAAAAPAADVAIGDHSVAEGTASFDVPVLITGGESLKDMAGIILVGGGGTLLLGRGQPSGWMRSAPRAIIPPPYILPTHLGPLAGAARHR